MTQRQNPPVIILYIILYSIYYKTDTNSVGEGDTWESQTNANKLIYVSAATDRFEYKYFL